jgi:hypothetical protein
MKQILKKQTIRTKIVEKHLEIQYNTSIFEVSIEFCVSLNTYTILK